MECENYYDDANCIQLKILQKKLQKERRETY